MTVLLERAGGPSELHEYRTATLSTMAVLCGYHYSLDALPDGGRPDVLRLRPTDGSLFIGDAKATETPGNVETFHRLSRYADFLAGWVSNEGVGVLALVVADGDAFGWLQVLRKLALLPSGGVSVTGHLDLIETGTVVIWQPFVGRAA